MASGNIPHHTVHREHMSAKHEEPTMIVQPWRPTKDLYDGRREATVATTGIHHDHRELHHSNHSRPTMMAMNNPSQ